MDVIDVDKSTKMTVSSSRTAFHSIQRLSLSHYCISSLKRSAPRICSELSEGGKRYFATEFVKDFYKAAGLKGGEFQKIGVE